MTFDQKIASISYQFPTPEGYRWHMCISKFNSEITTYWLEILDKGSETIVRGWVPQLSSNKAWDSSIDYCIKQFNEYVAASNYTEGTDIPYMGHEAQRQVIAPVDKAVLDSVDRPKPWWIRIWG